MPIHVPEPLTEEESDAKQCKPDQWPVTAPMLKSVKTQDLMIGQSDAKNCKPDQWPVTTPKLKSVKTQQLINGQSYLMHGR